MANVPAIQAFNDDLNTAVNALLVIRDSLHATDILWPSLNAGSKTNIKAQLDIDLAAAQVLVAALVVPTGA